MKSMFCAIFCPSTIESPFLKRDLNVGVIACPIVQISGWVSESQVPQLVQTLFFFPRNISPIFSW